MNKMVLPQMTRSGFSNVLARLKAATPDYKNLLVRNCTTRSSNTGVGVSDLSSREALFCSCKFSAFSSTLQETFLATS